MRDDSVYLQHVAESIDLIGDYLAGHDGNPDERLIYDDLRTQDAVLRRMETLADAAGHLSNALKGRHPQIPWGQITVFRNVLAHGYTDIRLDRVWEATLNDLPQLKAMIDAELD